MSHSLDDASGNEVDSTAERLKIRRVTSVFRTCSKLNFELRDELESIYNHMFFRLSHGLIRIILFKNHLINKLI